VTEILTVSDIATAIGYIAGSWGCGFIAGRLQLFIKKISESL